MLPPRVLFNASWFINENLVPLVEKLFPAWWSAWPRELVVYIENGPAHSSRKTQNVFGYNPLKRLPNPASSIIFLHPTSSCLGKERAG
jgi:hypothetical protein